MPVTPWKSWPLLALAGGALLVVSACAPEPRGPAPPQPVAVRRRARGQPLRHPAAPGVVGARGGRSGGRGQDLPAGDRARPRPDRRPRPAGRQPDRAQGVRRRRPHLPGRAEARRRQRRRASRLRPRDARPQPAGGGDRALPGGARAATRTTCRPTTGSASPSISPASTRRPRPPTAPAWGSRPTACCCATISACRWRSPAAMTSRSSCCATWSTSRAPRPATARTSRSPMAWRAIS